MSHFAHKIFPRSDTATKRTANFFGFIDKLEVQNCQGQAIWSANQQISSDKKGESEQLVKKIGRKAQKTSKFVQNSLAISRQFCDQSASSFSSPFFKASQSLFFRFIAFRSPDRQSRVSQLQHLSSKSQKWYRYLCTKVAQGHWKVIRVDRECCHAFTGKISSIQFSQECSFMMISGLQ